MYSKAEVAQIKRDFWTALGQYMKPIANADGEFINWINYKTGIKGVFLRWHADKNFVKASFEINAKDELDQLILWEKTTAVKKLFEEMVGNDWVWEEKVIDEFGKEKSMISISYAPVNIFKKEDWPTMISFLKTQMIKLDGFWCMVKMNFE